MINLFKITAVLKNNKRKEGIENAGGFLKYTSMAFQMIASILVCVFLGRYLDTQFINDPSEIEDIHHFPLFTFISPTLILSLIIAICLSPFMGIFGTIIGITLEIIFGILRDYLKFLGIILEIFRD